MLTRQHSQALISYGFYRDYVLLPKVNPMDLDFIAGLIDADGSLLLSLDKCPENRLGYTRKLVLDITNTDAPLLNKVQERLGFGRVVNTSATTFAYRANTHQDAK